MKLLFLALAAFSLSGQVQTFNNGELNSAVRAKINASFLYLDSGKAGISACAGGKFAIQTSTAGVVCLAVDWAVLTGVPAQLGNISMFSGAGTPATPDNLHASCTAPSGSNLNLYFDTVHQDQWWCSATDTWLKTLSVTNSGPYEVIGATGTAPSNPASGTVACYFDSTSNTQVCLDSGGNVSSMVKGLGLTVVGKGSASPSWTNIVTGTAASATVTVAGALTTDTVICTQTSPIQHGSSPHYVDLPLNCQISAANTLTAWNSGHDLEDNMFFYNSSATFNYIVYR